MTYSKELPLIAGAGPVGLAAALFLADKGIATRLIDQALQPSPTSRALAVNPRTLELLEPTGVTAAMFERGLKAHTIRIWRNGKTLASLSLAGLKHRYPFMLALSQAATENLLAEALQKRGGVIERGTTLTSCEGAVSLATATGEQIITPPWLLAADGAHSIARKQIGANFEGSSFPELWHLVDVPLSGNLQQDAAHITLLDEGGFIFMLPVIDDIRVKPQGDQVWRVLANFENPCDRLAIAKPSGPPVWTSQFHVAHRLASTFSKGNVYLAGDAAHIHSPMGARGMNLGIEDAWTFAELMGAGTPEKYAPLRHAVDGTVVARVKLATTVARGDNPFLRTMRRNVVPFLPRLPFLMNQFLKTGTGLDHDLKL